MDSSRNTARNDGVVRESAPEPNDVAARYTDSMSTPTLDYSPTSAGHFRRCRRRYFAALVVAALATVIAFVWHPAWQRAQCIYWCHRCLNFTAPGDTPIFKTGFRNTSRGGISWPSGAVCPDCWQRLQEVDSQQLRGQFLKPPYSGPALFSGQPVVFLHALRSPAGHRRLVAIQCYSVNALTVHRELVPTVIDPPGLFSSARVIRRQPMMYAISELCVPTCLFYGQIDPRDPSHVTFRFTVNQSNFEGRLLRPKYEGIIDGYLNDDDTMTFKHRDLATTQGL